MKQITCILWVCLLNLTLSACSDSEPTPTSPSPYPDPDSETVWEESNMRLLTDRAFIDEFTIEPANYWYDSTGALLFKHCEHLLTCHFSLFTEEDPFHQMENLFWLKIETTKGESPLSVAIEDQNISNSSNYHNGWVCFDYISKPSEMRFELNTTHCAEKPILKNFDIALSLISFVSKPIEAEYEFVLQFYDPLTDRYLKSKPHQFKSEKMETSPGYWHFFGWITPCEN